MHPHRMARHLQPPEQHVPAELLEFGRRRKEIMDVFSAMLTLAKDLETLKAEGFVYTPGAKHLCQKPACPVLQPGASSNTGVR